MGIYDKCGIMGIVRKQFDDLPRRFVVHHSACYMGEISKALNPSRPMPAEGSSAVFALFPWFGRSLSMYMDFQVDMGEDFIAVAIRFWIHNPNPNPNLRELCEELRQQSIMSGVTQVHLLLENDLGMCKCILLDTGQETMMVMNNNSKICNTRQGKEIPLTSLLYLAYPYSSSPNSILIFQLTVGAMTCATCVNSVEDIFRKLPGVRKALVVLATSLGRGRYGPSIISTLLNATEYASFEVSVVQSSEQVKIVLRVVGLSAKMDVQLMEVILSKFHGVKQFYDERKTRKLEVVLDLEVLGSRSLIDRIKVLVLLDAILLWQCDPFIIAALRAWSDVVSSLGEVYSWWHSARLWRTYLTFVDERIENSKRHNISLDFYLGNGNSITESVHEFTNDIAGLFISAVIHLDSDGFDDSFDSFLLVQDTTLTGGTVTYSSMYYSVISRGGKLTKAADVSVNLIRLIHAAIHSILVAVFGTVNDLVWVLWLHPVPYLQP
ncbi:copper-transporting atpase ran1 [Nicotiana attenuata]|uniref:Copper-transporting atpase ran1 n=1 Tax=Nicotiana attenuata TaxID=49451 RepID=A0A314KWU7_NICAT|nr:copper-transporting atpase ran1 [Nicotiana attenuata]